MMRLLGSVGLMAGAAFAGTVEHPHLVGTRVPDVTLQLGFPEPYVNLPERTAGKQVILVGLPGAFTPTWSTVQVPGYVEHEAALKEQGIDEILVVCVNDGAVMQAWAEDQGIAGTMVSFVADPNAVLVDALGMELTNPGEVNVLGPKRSKRFAAYIDDSVIKVFRTSEAEDDPAGGDDPSGTCYSSMVEAIQSVRSSADAEL